MAQANNKVTKHNNTQNDLFTAWLTLFEGAKPGDEPVRLPVLSGSMMPKIPLGTTLVINPCTASRVQRGDVVVFQEGNRLVAHRLLLHFHIGSLHVLFQKGDSNTHGSWISPDQIKGRVLEVERDQDVIPVFSTEAASQSLLHLFRSFIRNPGSIRR